jgi:hypothetical protein
MPDLKARLAGAVFVVASSATTLLHRSAFEAARGGPAGLAEWTLGLLTFVLANIGVVMLIHGSRTFAPMGRKPASATNRPVSAYQSATAVMPSLRCEGWDSRHELALVLAHRTIAGRRRGDG